jgi:hypothetical protein
MDDAEDRGRTADADRQRKQDHDREDGIPEQRTNRVAEILRQIFNHHHVTHITTLLFAPFDAAHGAQRGVARLLLGQAFGDVFFDLTPEMVL